MCSLAGNIVDEAEKTGKMCGKVRFRKHPELREDMVESFAGCRRSTLCSIDRLPIKHACRQEGSTKGIGEGAIWRMDRDRWSAGAIVHDRLQNHIAWSARFHITQELA